MIPISRSDAHTLKLPCCFATVSPANPCTYTPSAAVSGLIFCATNRYHNLLRLSPFPVVPSISVICRFVREQTQSLPHLLTHKSPGNRLQTSCASAICDPSHTSKDLLGSQSHFTQMWCNHPSPYVVFSANPYALPEYLMHPHPQPLVLQHFPMLSLLNFPSHCFASFLGQLQSHQPKSSVLIIVFHSIYHNRHDSPPESARQKNIPVASGINLNHSPAPEIIALMDAKYAVRPFPRFRQSQVLFPRPPLWSSAVAFGNCASSSCGHLTRKSSICQAALLYANRCNYQLTTQYFFPG